jgi:peptidylprolyl isomerase
MTRAKQGDRVKIHIVGRTSDGDVFNTTEAREPLLVQVGSNKLIAGLRDAIAGMCEGEEKRIVVSPKDGYGHSRSKPQHEVPVKMLPEGTSEGDKLHARVGEDLREVWVKDIGEENAILDENHPLAGETLEFDLKLVSIEAGS